MCMFCASIPAAAAVGAKLNVDQNRRLTAGLDSSNQGRVIPIPFVTSLIIVFLFAAAFLNHTFGWKIY